MGDLVKKSHCGSLSGSERLRQTYHALREGLWRTSAEIGKITNSVAVHSDVSDLRSVLKKTGNTVLSKYMGIINGRKVYAYKLEFTREEVSV